MFVKSVAIIGSHTRTRGDINWDVPGMHYWVFNEAACIGWPKKTDAVFQMHADAVWKNPNNRNDARYPDWMKQDHPYPVYMQQHYDNVPASVEYPLDHVCLDLLPGVTKGGEQVRYFTSSVAYALALAIHKGYERIELYGVEMESDTEYRYQRDGVFFWIGIALGRGIDVAVARESGFFREPVYGYEGDITVSIEYMETRIALLKDARDKAQANLDNANNMQKATLDAAMDEASGEPGMAEAAQTRAYFRTIKLQAQSTIELGMYDGALAEEERYLYKAREMVDAVGSYFLARQEFEIIGAQSREMEEKRRAARDVAGGAAKSAWENMSTAIKNVESEKEINRLAGVYAEKHREYLEACFNYGRTAGALNENVHLVDHVDDLIKAAGGDKAYEAMSGAYQDSIIEIPQINNNGNKPKKSTSRGRRKARVSA